MPFLPWYSPTAVHDPGAVQATDETIDASPVAPAGSGACSRFQRPDCSVSISPCRLPVGSAKTPTPMHSPAAGQTTERIRSTDSVGGRAWRRWRRASGASRPLAAPVDRRRQRHRRSPPARLSAPPGREQPGRVWLRASPSIARVRAFPKGAFTPGLRSGETVPVNRSFGRRGPARRGPARRGPARFRRRGNGAPQTPSRPRRRRLRWR